MLFSRSELRRLLAPEIKPPCVSITLPTHRSLTEAQQDPIRFKNLLRHAEEELAGRLKSRDARALLEPARELLRNELFWLPKTYGLAVFAAPNFFEWYRDAARFPERVTVSDRIHIKPLLPLLGADGRYGILSVSRHRIRFLTGTRHGVTELELPGVAHSLEAHPKQVLFHTSFKTLPGASGRRISKFIWPIISGMSTRRSVIT
jgi:hypothetical protein